MVRLSILLTALMLLSGLHMTAQPVPGRDENIPFLVTFGSKSETAWGDDDFCQIIFFSIPKEVSTPVYLRVFDADVSGLNDEQKGDWNSKMFYGIYGGKGACSNEDAQKSNMKGKYDSGTLLATKTFGVDAATDNKWYTFGPFNPSEGELLPEFGGNVFKFICEGTSGDDGNMYRLFLSSSPTSNVAVEGAFAFYFKYKFRLHDNNQEVSHIYPYIDKRVVAIKQANFDWDNDGVIRIVSVAKNGESMAVSGDNVWAESRHTVSEAEKNTSFDIQMIKNKKTVIRNNNVVMYLQNQFGELMPFYSVPIGGIPKYKYSIGVKPKTSK
ncbi:hypothetical protein LX69_01989 [Breznakibacter xylanolyticus]|uniref:Uncharacterized protein n=1 Tax=Breznakibacter xylanolyticus TaxID=990 RepID=A0A2W7NHF8_9BACT|nr:hypothetical protein [Breznakibacter xylanolyticus]PZX16114.1 hypothetical protein LX69_01989 [Breznakibacter xylanolyticus]